MTVDGNVITKRGHQILIANIGEKENLHSFSLFRAIGLSLPVHKPMECFLIELGNEKSLHA